MMEGEQHKYRIVGDKYIGHEEFVRANRLVVARTPEEAQDIVFQQETIVPARVRDLGTVVNETKLI